MRLSTSMGGDAAALTQPPRLRTQQEFSTSAAVASENLARTKILIKNKHSRYRRRPSRFFLGQQLTMWNNHDNCLAQEQMIKVAPEALAKCPARPVTMWNYYENCQVQEKINKKRPEAMPNFLLITIHLNLPSISTKKIPRYNSVAADIIK
jgi:hypothetical protein